MILGSEPVYKTLANLVITEELIKPSHRSSSDTNFVEIVVWCNAGFIPSFTQPAGIERGIELTVPAGWPGHISSVKPKPHRLTRKEGHFFERIQCVAYKGVKLLPLVFWKQDLSYVLGGLDGGQPVDLCFLFAYSRFGLSERVAGPFQIS